MTKKQDKRPKILLSELWDKVCEVSSSKRSYKLKIQSVLIVLAMLDSSKPGDIVKFIKKHNLEIGKDAYKEVKDILRYLIDINIVGKENKRYRLKYKVVPPPHLENIKIHNPKEGRYISDLADRIIRLRLADITLKEPAIALAIMSLLTELRIYLNNVSAIVNQNTVLDIRKAIEKIDNYQKILEEYYRKKEKPRDENIVFNQMEEAIIKLYVLSIKKRKKKKKKKPEIELIVYTEEEERSKEYVTA